MGSLGRLRWQGLSHSHGSSGALPSNAITPAWDPTIVSAFDVSMVAPDILCVEIRDAKITRGSPVNIGTSQGTHGQVVTIANPNAGGAMQTGVVCGPGNTYVRFNDVGPVAFLNRATVDTAANWSGSSLGGLTVTNVYRITKERETFQSFPVSSGASVDGATMSHQVYLKLSGSLANGDYSLVNAAIPSITFTRNDKSFHACSIHATQVGHRASDSRKLASLSHWIPGYGTEGRVDFATTYGFNTAHIIDSSGNVKYTMTSAGGQITLKNDAATAETNVSDTSHLIILPSTTVPPKTITGISNATTGVVTVPSHGYTTGQFKVLRGIGTAGGGGMPSLEGMTVKIVVIDANTFQIQDRFGNPVNTTSSGTFTASGLFIASLSCLCYNGVVTNRAATPVWQLDYSAWTTGTAGTYFVYVPGYGVSYPFQIGENVHYLAAKQAMKGYYNQMYGVALSAAVGGVDRPVNFKDGVNSVTIFKSNLPGMLSVEMGGGVPGAINPYLGSGSPWLTTTRMTGWYGGWSDAGDWDMHIFRHWGAVYSLLEHAHESLPSGVKNNHTFGFPKMTTLLDATTYAGTDSLSDGVHMAAYYIDVLRRFQDGSGWVPSGVAYSAGDDGNGGSPFEPTYISTQTCFVHAGDHPSNYAYAFVALKFAKILLDAGFTTLGNLWKTSGLNAFNVAENMWQDYQTNNVAGTVVNAYYGPSGLNIQANMGWNSTQYKAALDQIHANCGGTNGGVRIACFAMLYRLTNDFTTYGNLVYTNYQLNLGGLGAEYCAAVEYIRTTDLATRADTGHGTGAAQISGYTSILQTAVDNLYAAGLNAGTVSSYEYLELNNFFSPAGSDGPLTAYLMQGSLSTSKYLKMIHSGGNFWSGANQENMCCTVGLGSKFPSSTLIKDREAMGLSTAQYPGTVPFTWWWDNTGGGGFACLAAGSSDINFSVGTPSLTNDPKFVEPYYLSIPPMQSYHGNTFMVFTTEFTTQGQIVPAFVTALWRWCWDGNTSTTP
jgi:hypothetical protein